MVSFSFTPRPLLVFAAGFGSPNSPRRMPSALTLAASVGIPLGLGQVLYIFLTLSTVTVCNLSPEPLKSTKQRLGPGSRIVELVPSCAFFA